MNPDSPVGLCDVAALFDVRGYGGEVVAQQVRRRSGGLVGPGQAAASAQGSSGELVLAHQSRHLLAAGRHRWLPVGAVGRVQCDPLGAVGVSEVLVDLADPAGQRLLGGCLGGSGRFGGPPGVVSAASDPGRLAQPGDRMPLLGRQVRRGWRWRCWSLSRCRWWSMWTGSAESVEGVLGPVGGRLGPRLMAVPRLVCDSCGLALRIP